ncbi:NAD(P)H-dependent flavin oxidoreductase [Oryzicola mucosus]|uniref:Nitronate monooxygenase n=1 Tax=Oryzicola mucosus TaxID=2767425 RepID=A0A8J6PRA2_9HYPH|nr:nitronate monooxygenase [Oryzicola mucosus]MBD0416745.1 nitronate monooxygenase [Oryzicola mucosus]
MRPQVFETSITTLLGIRHPLLCGGLGPGVSDGRYVAATVNAGGMGFIVSTGYDDPDRFEEELKICRQLTGGKQFGVNLYISRFAGGVERVLDLLHLLDQYGVACVETAGASPEPIIPALKEMRIKVLHKVPAVRYVPTAVRIGADAVIVVGADCGGHPGVYQISSIVQATRAPEIASIPVVAAGGFGTGRQLVAALSMGCGAMLMGSRMMVAEELWVHEDYKRRVVAGDGTESQVVKKLLRDHHRVLDNDSAKAILALEDDKVTDFEAYRPHINGAVTRHAYRSGDVSKGMIDYGPAVVFADKIKPVEAIFDEIVDDAVMAMARLASLQVPQDAVEAKQ